MPNPPVEALTPFVLIRKLREQADTMQGQVYDLRLAAHALEGMQREMLEATHTVKQAKAIMEQGHA